MAGSYTTPALMGLYLGLAVGLLDYIVLNFIGHMMAKKGREQNASPEDMRKVTGYMRGLGLISLIIFPIIGYFAGPYVFGAAG